jgi:hypothetical protein
MEKPMLNPTRKRPSILIAALASLLLLSSVGSYFFGGKIVAFIIRTNQDNVEVSRLKCLAYSEVSHAYSEQLCETPVDAE